uniref:F-box domain-containing protein n=1 Tax=Fusarium oxysporum (strain Fo5176) TaxID=660025 RepID=A0A0D2YDW6_FUSOF
MSKDVVIGDSEQDLDITRIGRDKNAVKPQNSLKDSAHLKITRIFISPSPRNIDVLLGVANHDIYRKEIEEIIWDDSPLESIEWNTGTPCCHDTVDEWSEEDNSEDDAYAEPYSQESEESNRKKFSRFKLMKRAFLYALERFPNLTTIEVTPAAHGQLYMPLYTTPMIRELPYGFPYPIPRGWPCPAYDTFPHDVEEKGDDWWRSFRFVIKALANMDQRRISELVLDNHYLPTGINPFIFTSCDDDYNNICKVVEKPGFNRFVLSLITGWIRDDGEYEDWGFYRNGSIRKFLAKASDLEEMVFKTDYNLGDGSLVGMRDYVSLFDLFPLDAWPKLRHFGLVGMQVTQENLISFLRQLPSTVRSIDLSFLAILEGQGTHEGTLTDIRDKLGWRSLPLEKRISIRYLVHGGPCQRPSPSPSYICLNKEVEEYVYKDGPLPVESSRHPRDYNARNAEGMVKPHDVDS